MEHFEGMDDAPEIPQDFDCYRSMIEGVEGMCGKFSAYSLQYTYKLANVCDTKTSEEVANIFDKIGEFCQAL